MLDRRAFLAAGGASVALLRSLEPLAAQGATVVRRSLRGMSANDPDLAALRRAVAAMKALPQSDARNWTRFADVHRNFCPHGNWYFLPWHRAYLTSFEAICRDLSGKRDFALPYWDWTLDRELPAAFTAGNRNSNPLNHDRPGANGLRLADDMVGPQVISRILNSPDFEAFGSTRPRGQDSASSQWQRREGSRTELEFNPHDGVHLAIGGNMATIEMSPRDPIFYMHHANIDRLWAAWNRRGHANSSDPMWRDFTFSRNFPNPDGTPMNIGVGEVTSTPALGYRYDDDDGPFAADLVPVSGDLMTEKLSTYRRFEARGVIDSGPGLRRLDFGAGGSIQVAVVDNNQVASRDRPIAITVPLGRALGDIVGPQAFAFRPDRPDRAMYRRYAWAFLRDLDAPLDPTTRVRVFCNCEELTPRTRLDHPSYASSASFFGSHGGHGGMHHGGGARSLCFDLSPVLDRLNPLRSDRLTVQLLPTCASNQPYVSNIRPRRVEVVIL